MFYSAAIYVADENIWVLARINGATKKGLTIKRRIAFCLSIEVDTSRPILSHKNNTFMIFDWCSNGEKFRQRWIAFNIFVRRLLAYNPGIASLRSNNKMREMSHRVGENTGIILSCNRLSRNHCHITLCVLSGMQFIRFGVVWWWST